MLDLVSRLFGCTAGCQFSILLLKLQENHLKHIKILFLLSLGNLYRIAYMAVKVEMYYEIAPQMTQLQMKI